MSRVLPVLFVLLSGCDSSGGTDAGTRSDVVIRDACECDANTGSDARVDAAAGSDFSLQFFGNGGTYDDRVRILIDDPMTSEPGPPVDVGGDDFTIDFWIRAQPGDNPNPARCGPGIGWTESNIIVDRDRHSQPPTFGIGIGSDAILFAVLGPADDSLTLCGSATVTDGAWHHIAVQRRRSDGRMWIFVDGEIDAEQDGPDGDISYPDDGIPMSVCPGGLCDYSDPYLVFGAEKHGYGGISYRGLFDEVRVSDVLRYTGSFVPPAAAHDVDSSTVAYYRFSEGSGTSSSEHAGRSPDAELVVGGDPAGPQWSTDTPF